MCSSIMIRFMWWHSEQRTMSSAPGQRAACERRSTSAAEPGPPTDDWSHARRRSGASAPTQPQRVLLVMLTPYEVA